MSKNRCCFALFLLVGAGFVAGCGAAPEASPPPAAPGWYAPTSTSPAPTAAPTAQDFARCQAACSTLTACGVAYGPSCPSDCMQMPVFRACVQAAPPAALADCNALALCAFQQGAAASCGGQPGVPAGTQSCGAAALCEGMCTVANQPAACSCACAASLAPGKAIKLLINNQCAHAKCGSACAPGGSGPACIACFQANCQAENAQCAADAPASLPTPAPAPAPLPAPVQTGMPTPEAQAGTLDPQLFGLWPLESVQVIYEGSSVPDQAISDALATQLGSQQLQLGSDGLYFLGAGRGTWRVVPFTAADRARWGTGGQGPRGYTRKIVLTRTTDGQTIEGPITDPAPPATAPWSVKLGTRFTEPRPGFINLEFVRPQGAPSPGVKR